MTIRIALPALLSVIAIGGASFAVASDAAPKSDIQATAKTSEVSTEAVPGVVVIEEAAAVEAVAWIVKISGPDTRSSVGKGFAPASEGQLLNAGDSLFAGPDSQIVIHYNEGNCTEVVPAETFARVKEKVSCEDTAALPGSGEAALVVPTADAPYEPETDRRKLGALFLAVGSGVVACAILCDWDDDDDDDDPVSPN